MGDLTSYLAKKLGDHAIGKASFTMPTTVYLGLLTSNPTKAGTATSEVSGGSYARQALTSIMGAFDSSTGISTNSSQVAFPTPTADWGFLAYWGIFDASTSGNMLFFGGVGNARTIVSGASPVQIATGDVSIEMS